MKRVNNAKSADVCENNGLRDVEFGTVQQYNSALFNFSYYRFVCNNTTHWNSALFQLNLMAYENIVNDYIKDMQTLGFLARCCQINCLYMSLYIGKTVLYMFFTFYFCLYGHNGHVFNNALHCKAIIQYGIK